MRNDMMTRRGFVATSAIALAGVALAGCAGNAKQEAPAGSPQSSQEPSGSSPSSAATAASASEASASNSSASGKVLVACFSATGNTMAIAKMLTGHLNADFFEIEPAEPYTAEDLNYNDGATRATVEQNNPDTRPALAASPDFSAYDTVLLGHPIWWGQAPRLICTLVENASLSGKKVAEFCTSGSSGINAASDELKGLAPGAEWIGARRFAAGAAEAEVAEWADSLGIR